MEKLLNSPSTDIYIGEGLLATGEMAQLLNRGNKVIVADRTVKELYGIDLAQRIGAELLVVPTGERGKTQETATHLIGELSKMGAGKDTTLIALGGGGTTDLVGFVASIYMRGLPLILIPTTLLAMVDAAIGGKTAINTPFGKNLIGTFYPPHAVFADLSTLQTLPEKERFNGLAEILKMGLIQDRTIWEREENRVLRAIQGKIAIVERDPKERGLRRILNFGHTIGHGLEAVSSYKMPHGEAVALGCVVESHLSMCLGYLSSKEFEEIERRYRSFPLKLPKGYNRHRLLEAMSHDKKKEAGEIRFVLLDQIGRAISFEDAYCRPVGGKELESSLDWMEKVYR